METHIPAIYEGGILRPLGPISLHESEVVTISIVRETEMGEKSSDAADKGRRHREVLLRFIEDAKKLPDNSPNDGFSNRDHDQVIYGV